MKIRLGGGFHVIDGRIGLGDRLACLAHHLKVRGQRVLEVTQRLFSGVADGGASGHIRRIRRSRCLYLR